MNWISVKSRLPQSFLNVELMTESGATEKVYFDRHLQAWYFPSGLKWRKLDHSDQWREIPKELPNVMDAH